MAAMAYVASSRAARPYAPLSAAAPAPSIGFEGGIDKVASGGYLTIMHTVGLKILKNRLSEYVRLAAAGETVVITDRGRTVAEIGPPRKQRRESFVERGVR